MCQHWFETLTHCWEYAEHQYLFIQHPKRPPVCWETGSNSITRPGRGASRLSRDTQTSLSPDISSSFSGGSTRLLCILKLPCHIY
ncbi:hypothetical protein AMECASPLE_015055 [Ameca splendens]|uniref:Uncharacterized protein n=1 Tax=Ameca splendens TaxID=208324 RepID=A0ABV0YNS6_9TELE